MPFSKTIQKLSLDPKQLFFIDGIGALVSAFMLGVVLVAFQTYIGLPKPTLYLLATLPCLFAIYDFYCLKNIIKNLHLYLKGIAYINISYCILSALLTIFHFQELTVLGLTYFVFEILIVLMISKIELLVAKNIKAIEK